MSTTKDYYTDYWAGGAEDRSPRYYPIGTDERKTLSIVQASDRVLDVGCGDGRIADHLIARGVRDYTGIDVSPTAIGLCQRRGIRCQVCDLTDALPFADNSFERITIFEVLEHLFDPEYCAGEILRVLRPGGTILGSVPNVAYLPNRLLMLCGVFNPGGLPETSIKATWKDPHIRFFTMRTLKGCLEARGFEDVKIRGQGFSFARLPILYRAPPTAQRCLAAVSWPLMPLGRVYGGLFGARLYFAGRKPP
jgi:methionine biosynthesis protein MetW